MYKANYEVQVKEKLEILSSIRDHRKKRETREVAYTCRYTGEYLIPNSVYTKTKTELGIKCSLVYLQV